MSDGSTTIMGIKVELKGEVFSTEHNGKVVTGKTVAEVLQKVGV